jgi:hypothetical protein
MIFGHEASDVIGIIIMLLVVVLFVRMLRKILLERHFSDGDPCYHCGNNYCYLKNDIEYCSKCKKTRDSVNRIS